MKVPEFHSPSLARFEIPIISLAFYAAKTDAQHLTPEGHFVVHFATHGKNSSTLAYAQQVGQHLEASWTHEVGTLGFPAPSLGFDGRLDIFIWDLGTGLYGLAFPSVLGLTDGYILINRDFSWAPSNDDPGGDAVGALKVTAAHEFFHHIQFASLNIVQALGESWWMESSATFMEDEVFDGVNDYRNYLSTFYSSTHVTIDEIGGGYETVLINKLLKERFNGGGAGIIKEVLDKIGVFTSTEEAMGEVLAARGSSLADCFHHFSLWNFLTGSRNKPGHYEEGASYPTFSNFQDTHSIGSSNKSTGEKSVSVDNLAANYYRINPESSLTDSKTLNVKVSRGSDQIRGWVVVERSGNQIDTNELVFGADNKAEVKVSSFSASTVTDVVVILSNGDEHFSRSVTYSAALEQGLDLMFVIDTTGSMFDDIAAVKAAATQIVNELDSKGVDYRVAVINYEDFPVSPFGDAGCGDAPFHDVLAFTNNKAAIVSAIQSLTLRCGNDTPESVLSALMHGIGGTSLGSWRSGVTKAIVLMGDAPGHDPEPFTGFTTPGVVAAASGTTTTSVIAAAVASEPIQIFPIAIGFDPGAINQFSTLATGTGGKLFQAPTASQVVAAILEALGDIITPSNSPPNCTFAVAQPSQVWPPNHKLITVSILGVVDPDADPVTITITAITQDEPVLGTGSGDIGPDGFGVGTNAAMIRAERSGAGNGRIYEISFVARDTNGNECAGKVKVSISHDQGANTVAVDDGQQYNSTLPN